MPDSGCSREESQYICIIGKLNAGHSLYSRIAQNKLSQLIQIVSMAAVASISNKRTKMVGGRREEVGGSADWRWFYIDEEDGRTWLML